MKYKKLFGGDDPLQPIKTNSLPEVSAMDSAKGTLNSLTSFYKKIILFVKQNIIFSILAVILVGIYIFLFTTDVVTQADIESKIINKKCSEFTDTCPFGKRVEESLDCDVDNCTPEKCCVDDNNCSSFTGTCPTNYIKMDDANLSCKASDGTCGPDDCCVKTCDAEASITQADCTGPDTEYRGASKCTGDNNVCQESDCCHPRVYCGGGTQPYTGCTESRPNKANMDTIVCPNGLCDMDTCCEADTSICSSYTCEPLSLIHISEPTRLV